MLSRDDHSAANGGPKFQNICKLGNGGVIREKSRTCVSDSLEEAETPVRRASSLRGRRARNSVESATIEVPFSLYFLVENWPRS